MVVDRNNGTPANPVFGPLQFLREFLRSTGTTGVPVGCSVGAKIAPAAELGEIGADLRNSWNSGPE